MYTHRCLATAQEAMPSVQLPEEQSVLADRTVLVIPKKRMATARRTQTANSGKA